MDTNSFQIFTPTLQENEYLQSLDEYYKDFSEMNQQEREFLNALILRYKPQKLLEIGVSAGGGSVIMLNAIKNFSNAKLHSIDYCKKWYRNTEKDTGFAVEHYPELSTRYNLYTGGMTYKFIDEISSGQKIDFVLIDTTHRLPGEILDVLQVLPFLDDNAIVVFHDTNMHTVNIKKNKNSFVNNLLISSLFGRKIWQGNFNRTDKFCFPNIAGIQLSWQSKEHIFELFNLLTLNWLYLPSVEEISELAEFFSKHYPTYFAEYFKQIYDYQEKIFDERYHYTIKIKTPVFLKKYTPVFLKKLFYKIRFYFE